LSASGAGFVPAEIDNRWYDDLGVEGWWDPGGPVAALHEVNPTRVAYFLDAIRRHAPTDRSPRVLDVGCGGGLVAEALAVEGCTVIGIDPSHGSLVAGRQHAGPGDRAARYVRGVGERLPFADASFDAVVAADSLEHVDSPPRVLRELRRVARPHAVLCFDTPNRTWLTRVGLIWGAELLGWVPRGTHVFEQLFAPRELAAACLEAGWLVEEIRGLSLSQPLWSAALGYLRRRRLGGFDVGDDDRLSFIGWATPMAPAAGVE
jgi:2-polyprenyl-6-hydroxyphenyl methylase/3-demethylubiquinone-9 3-methyltransferase